MPRRPTSPPSVSRRLRRRIAPLAVATALAVGLGGCGAASSLGTLTRPADARVYDAAADAAGRLPGWIPEDATGIRVKTSLRGDGSILEFRTATPADALGCAAVDDDTTTPAVQDTWWPDPSPAATMTCGDGWHAAADGELVRAWLAAGTPALAL